MDPVEINSQTYLVPLRIVNVFLLVITGGLILVDTGPAGSEQQIFDAISTIGFKPADIKSIVVTHSHYDHAGSLAAIVAATGAPVYMHPSDAALVSRGIAYRFKAPLLNKVIHLLTLNSTFRVPRIHIAPVRNIRHINDGDLIPGGNGLRVIHAPGHWAGQIAIYQPANQGLLIVADMAENNGMLALSPQNEDPTESLATLKKICGMHFNVALFSHGHPILSHASTIFKEVFC